MADGAADAAIDRALAICSESFIAAAGPGGQNVNKVATAVQLRVDVYALRLAPLVFARFKELAGSRMTAKGELVFTARCSSVSMKPCN
jgi:ribosome-associated protein